MITHEHVFCFLSGGDLQGISTMHQKLVLPSFGPYRLSSDMYVFLAKDDYDYVVIMLSDFANMMCMFML